MPAEPGRETMQAAVLRPFHWHDDFITMELPVADGAVQRDPAATSPSSPSSTASPARRKISRMFWLGCGPTTPDTALGCSVAHDKHNVWCVGSSDAAMAMAVNRLAEIDGGWVLVSGGKVLAEVRFEIGGLMTARPAEELDAEMQAALCGGGKGRMALRADLLAALVSGLSRSG